MEEGRWAAGKEGVQTALAGLPEGQMASRLRSLPAEVEVRLELAEAEEKARQERFGEAAEGMDRARQKMGEISYRSELEAVVVDLAAERERYRELGRTRGWLEAIREEMPGVVEKGEYGRAEALYGEGLPLTAGDPQARQELEREVRVARALAELERGLQEGETEGQVVARLQGMLRSFPGHKAVRKKAEGLIGSMLLPGLERQARDARRPGEVSRALTLARDLKEVAGELDRGDLGSRCEEVEKKLRGRQDQQGRLRQRYEAAADEQGRQQVLEEAQQEGLELYDSEDQIVAVLLERSRKGLLADQFRGRVEEFSQQKQKWEGVLSQIGEWNSILEQFEEKTQSPQWGTFLSTLALLRLDRDTVESLEKWWKAPPTQLDERRRLRDQVTLERSLIALEEALRRFQVQDAEQWLRIAEELKKGLGEAASPYQGQIGFLRQELEEQRKLEGKERSVLAAWRAALDEGRSLGNTADLPRNLADRSGSVFVRELYSLARLPSGLSSYEQAQARKHAEWWQELGGKDLEALQQDWKSFEEKWRGLKGAEGVRHNQFLATWSNRIAQARALKDTIQALRNYLGQPDGDLFHLAIWMVRIESMTDSVSDEVLAAYAEEWTGVVDQAVQYVRERDWGSNSSWVTRLARSLTQKIEEKKQRGQILINTGSGRQPGNGEQLSDRGVPAGNPSQPAGLREGRRR